MQILPVEEPSSKSKAAECSALDRVTCLCNPLLHEILARLRAGHRLVSSRRRVFVPCKVEGCVEKHFSDCASILSAPIIFLDGEWWSRQQGVKKGRLGMGLARLIRSMPPALAESWCWASVPSRSNPEWTSSVTRVLLQHPLSR
jgi:hypothetical protein